MYKIILISFLFINYSFSKYVFIFDFEGTISSIDTYASSRIKRKMVKDFQSNIYEDTRVLLKGLSARINLGEVKGDLYIRSTTSPFLLDVNKWLKQENISFSGIFQKTLVRQSNDKFKEKSFDQMISQSYVLPGDEVIIFTVAKDKSEDLYKLTTQNYPGVTFTFYHRQLDQIENSGDNNHFGLSHFDLGRLWFLSWKTQTRIKSLSYHDQISSYTFNELKKNMGLQECRHLKGLLRLNCLSMIELKVKKMLISNLE